MKGFYLVLTLIGLVVPYFFFLSFVSESGLNGGLLLRELLGTKISTSFATDLLISGLVFLGYVRAEAARLRVPYWWLYGLAMLIIGLSFAFPLFLYVRETRIQR
jgi:hypothetical protein